MSQPDISIIVPVYPTLRQLDRAIASLANQKLKSLEIVVVTDGVEDLSMCPALLDKFADTDIKFVMHDKNKSSLQARISGCKVAQGRYISFLDKDDEVTEVYKRAVELADENQYDIVGYYMSGRKIKWKCTLNGKTEIMRHFHYKHKHMMANVNHYIYRKEIIDKGLEQFDFPKDLYCNYAEDNLLFLAFMSVAEKMYEDWTLGTYIYHRDNPQSICTRMNRDRSVYADGMQQKNTVNRMITAYVNKYHITKRDVGFKDVSTKDMLAKRTYEGIWSHQ